MERRIFKKLGISSYGGGGWTKLFRCDLWRFYFMCSNRVVSESRHHLLPQTAYRFISSASVKFRSEGY
ncbi:hypothetical protein NPIL_385301 [Nephila pilipes]|uniref:Uncharacterized protein n=1 Tax=Nephila pilipes TaxID=299642 RepID=A0A8X6QBY3_NEPPI|nr:hypothetical protein NPIL_581861 [Nephila pilipes]GFT21172.1 hypothetical protein NPIL_272401 [Nephila pilipes]GFU18358.1 hypothetical protein NPIL_536571 [Nephila pilipes]GFU61251.1 hypothetical protein NPIL_385301 [Nephila pilipes]